MQFKLFMQLSTEASLHVLLFEPLHVYPLNLCMFTLRTFAWILSEPLHVYPFILLCMLFEPFIRTAATYGAS
jgi:hypothetical protein